MQLRTLLAIVVGITTLIALVVLSGVFSAGLNDYRSETAEQAVRVRATTLGTMLERSLHEEWRNVELAAAAITSVADRQALQDRIDAMGATNEKVSWIGIAAPDGMVLASTRGMLVGENVGQRDWFQQGLTGPFAGDVHDALLLARLMQPEASDPLRFVDFSAPVLDASGNVIAVLGAHVNWQWVRGIVDEAAQLLELDAIVVNREGTIILSTAVIDESVAQVNSLQAARRGVAGVFEETWPDGVRYQVFTVPNLTYGSMPPFGWSLVARLDPAALAGPQQRFQTRFGLAAIAAWALVLAAFVFVAGILIMPLRRISSALLAQARGQPVTYVREHRRFKEVQVLSEVLARLQSGGRDAPPR